MTDDRTTDERILGVMYEVRENELEQLLSAVRRISDGLNGFRDLAITLAPGSAPADPWRLDEEELAALHACQGGLVSARHAKESTAFVSTAALGTLIESISRRRAQP